jgi:hypothetical protein
MKTRTDADGHAPGRPMRREQARAARHTAYVLAKERRKNDPRTLELKEKLKQARREANAQAKERRKNDPKEIALKAKLKADRKEANKLAKEQRKARAGRRRQPSAPGRTRAYVRTSSQRTRWRRRR